VSERGEPPRPVRPDAPTGDVPPHDAPTGDALPAPARVDVPIHAALTSDGPPPGHRDAPTGPPAPTSEAASDRLRQGLRLGGRYELVSLLGRGGMGAVWRARDLEAGGREVALKLVLASGSDASRRARFQREGEVTASLSHPGIVRVHAAGDLDGVPFLAYELVEGGRTFEHVLGPATPLSTKVELVRDAARALGAAHQRGVVHRDVKPSNVLVDAAGHVRVADFGLAAAAGLERLTQTGALVGTPTHMAPEQLVSGATPGPTTDVWALGVVLYQALTGALPFRAETLLQLGMQISSGAYTAPRALVPDLPIALEAICVTALAPSPADRYPHGDALADDLDRWLAGDAPTLAALPARRRLRRRAHLALGVCVAAALLGLAAAAQGWAARRRARFEREALAREADVFARQAIGRPDPLRVDAAERQALLARLEEASAPDDVDLVTPWRRLRALDALDRPARAAALREALDLAPGAASDELDLLTRAIDAGWLRAELHLLRAQAVGRRGELDTDLDARRVLRDLERARAGGLATDEHAEAARALAYARLRQVDDALAALARAPGAAPSVRWAVALARVEAAVERDRPTPTSLLPDGPLPFTQRAAGARLAERLRALVRPDLDTLAREPSRMEADDVERVVERLELALRLDPATPPRRADLDALVSAVMSIHQRVTIPVARRIADLSPHDPQLQTTLTQWARGANALGKTLMIPVALRGYALARDEQERREQGLSLCIVYDGADPERPEDVEPLATELLARDGWDDMSRATLHELRHEARRRLGRYEEALLDVDEAFRLLPERDALLVDRAQVLKDMGKPEEALEHAMEYVRRAQHGDVQIAMTVMDEVTLIVWETGRAVGRLDLVRQGVTRFLRSRPERWGWWLRAAHLALQAGEERAAFDAVERAIVILQAEEESKRRGCLPDATAVLAALGDRAPDAAARLERLVEKLELLRGEQGVP
jgi:tetratricopeptide (TPR) repeat protein